MPKSFPFGHPLQPPLSQSRFTFNRHLLNLSPINLWGRQRLSLITDVIEESPGASAGRESGRSGQQEPAPAPPGLTQLPAGLTPGLGHPYLPAECNCASLCLCPHGEGAAPLQWAGLLQGGCRRLAHGLPEEDEQLIQAGLTQELHIWVPEGE